VEVADGDGQGISGVGRLGKLREMEKPGDHELHLFLLCQSVAHNGRLYTERRIFCHWELLLCGCEQRDTPDLTQFESRFGIDGVEDFFDGDHVWLPALQLFGEDAVNVGEASGKRFGFAETDGSDGEANELSERTGIVRIHHAKPGNFGSAIHAEYAHLLASLNLWQPSLSPETWGERDDELKLEKGEIGADKNGFEL
jgi:hypothetical protein